MIRDAVVRYLPSTPGHVWRMAGGLGKTGGTMLDETEEGELEEEELQDIDGALEEEAEPEEAPEAEPEQTPEELEDNETWQAQMREGLTEVRQTQNSILTQLTTLTENYQKLTAPKPKPKPKSPASEPPKSPPSKREALRSKRKRKLTLARGK